MNFCFGRYKVVGFAVSEIKLSRQRALDLGFGGCLVILSSRQQKSFSTSDQQS